MREPGQNSGQAENWPSQRQGVHEQYPNPPRESPLWKIRHIEKSKMAAMMLQITKNEPLGHTFQYVKVRPMLYIRKNSTI